MVDLNVFKLAINSVKLLDIKSFAAVHYAKSSAGWSAYLNGMQVDYDQFTKELVESVEYVKKSQAGR